MTAVLPLPASCLCGAQTCSQIDIQRFLLAILVWCAILCFNLKALGSPGVLYSVLVLTGESLSEPCTHVRMAGDSLTLAFQLISSITLSTSKDSENYRFKSFMQINKARFLLSVEWREAAGNKLPPLIGNNQIQRHLRKSIQCLG